MTAPVRLYGPVADRRHPRRQGVVQRFVGLGRVDVAWNDGTSSTVDRSRLVAAEVVQSNVRVVRAPLAGA